jgi:membrane protease YdiL (CAAX protease family)
VAFQSTAEEVFFRGWLQPLLCARWGPWFGLATTAALFGALHLIAGVHGPLAVANVFLAGLLFGLLALRSGGILAPLAAHFAWNWTESGLLGLAPAPMDSLFHLRLGGAALWSGGADAMDGSLGPTLVLLVLDACLIALGRKAR